MIAAQLAALLVGSTHANAGDGATSAPEASSLAPLSPEPDAANSSNYSGPELVFIPLLCAVFFFIATTVVCASRPTEQQRARQQKRTPVQAAAAAKSGAPQPRGTGAEAGAGANAQRPGPAPAPPGLSPKGLDWLLGRRRNQPVLARPVIGPPAPLAAAQLQPYGGGVIAVPSARSGYMRGIPIQQRQAMPDYSEPQIESMTTFPLPTPNRMSMTLPRTAASGIRSTSVSAGPYAADGVTFGRV